MEAIKIPYSPVLSGGEAIKAIQEFTRQVKEERNEELTTKQTKTLIKLAQGLISSIEAERVSTCKGNKEMPIRKRFNKSILKHLGYAS